MFGKRKGRKAREKEPAASYEDTKNNMMSSAEERIMASKKRSEDHDALPGTLAAQELRSARTDKGGDIRRVMSPDSDVGMDAFGTKERKAALADVQAARPDVMKRVSAAKAPAAAPSMLSRGVFNNNDVRRLQTDLKDMAAALNIPELDPGAVDGDFGKNTETALKELQGRLGMEQTGVADEALRSKIFEIRQDSLLLDRPALDGSPSEVEVTATEETVSPMRGVGVTGKMLSRIPATAKQEPLADRPVDTRIASAMTRATPRQVGLGSRELGVGAAGSLLEKLSKIQATPDEKVALDAIMDMLSNPGRTTT